MNSAIRFALGLAQMPDQTVADLDKSLPGMARMAAIAKELEPLLQKAEPHIEALLPLAQEALPILKRAYPDFVAVLPTVEELVQFASQK